MSHKNSLKSKTFRVICRVLALVILGVAVTSVRADRPTPGRAEPGLFNRCWDFKIASNVSVVPVVDSTAIYFIDTQNNLLAIDPKTAARLWSSELGGEVVSNLILDNSSVLLVTTSQATETASLPKTYLRSISRTTGITEWRTEIKPSDSVWIGGNTASVVTVGSAGFVSAVTRNDGKTLWESALRAPITTSPLFGPDGIIVGTENKEIVLIAVGDGSSRPLMKSEHLPTALAIETSGRLVVGDERGSVTAIGTDGDRSWAFRNGARISSVLLDASNYLASSNDNFVYRLTRSGGVKWKRRLPGRLAQPPTLLGDVGVMSVSSGGGIFILDLNSGKILNRIETGGDASLMIGASANPKNFVVLGPSAVSYFSREKCLSK